MNDPIALYFTGEKNAGVLCVVLAVLSVALTLWVWRVHPPLRAIAAPLLLIGLIQLAIGLTLASQTRLQVASLRHDLASQPETARAQELARMDRVNRNFTRIKIVEAVLIVAALALILAFRSSALVAIGLGLLLQTSVMLVFDVFAERRAQVYTTWLRG
jgi:hypothetical protein